MSDIATWSIPTGSASDKTQNIIERIKHYRFVQVHRLNDNTKIIPDVTTCMTILQCYDELGEDFPMAVEEKTFFKV